VTCEINFDLYIDLNMLPATHQYSIEQYRNFVNNEVETCRKKQPLREYNALSWHLPGKDCVKLKKFSAMKASL
jgi:hypothetical protein